VSGKMCIRLHHDSLTMMHNSVALPGSRHFEHAKKQCAPIPSLGAVPFVIQV
jgi:hypothetical protein